MKAWSKTALMLAAVGMMSALARPAAAGVDVEFDIPDGQQVSAEKMARALIEALETADAVQRPLLLQALAAVLEMSPGALIDDARADRGDSVY